MPSKPPPRGDRRGVRIGKYEILTRIATGSMGPVYRARDSELGREVALKVLPPEMASKPGLLERFRRAVRQVAKLRHPHLVTLFEFGEEHGTCVLAQEFVEGTSLQEQLRSKGKIDPDEACLIVIQAVQALEYAHQHGVLHRDIKPSNLLLGRKDGKVHVKVADLALAAQAADEDGPAGTTAYRAPEQARDRKAADGRSDLYALGCVFFHMVTGKPPFEGTGAAKPAEPPDARALNPKVTEEQDEVLRRMLAPKPEDRYQTAGDLLKALVELRPSSLSLHDLEELAGLAEEATAPRRPRRREVEEETEPGTAGDEPAETGPPDVDTLAGLAAEDEGAKAGKGWRNKYLIGGAVALVLVVGGVIAALVSDGGPRKDDRRGAGHLPDNLGPQPEITRPEPSKREAEPAPKVEKKDPPKVVEPGVKPTPEPAKPQWPALYQPAAALDTAKLQKEFEGPWAKVLAAPPDTPVFQVSRYVSSRPVPKEGANAGRLFGSLAAACAAAPEGRFTIIELWDNGPLFETPIRVTGRSLVIRAAAGFRPLLVWDVAAMKGHKKDEPLAFLSVTQGDLLIGNVELVLRWTDPPTEPVSLLHVADGEFFSQGCVFSVAAKHRAGVPLVRFEGSAAGKRCRFSTCFARGNNLAGVDVRAPGADVTLDNCLWAGGDAPLLNIDSHKDKPTTVRVLRSTLAANQTLLQVRPDPADPANPTLHWMGWDALLARAGAESGGVMVDLPAGATPAAMKWRAVNCLYAGWRVLLSGSAPVAAADPEAWHKRWQMPEGDVATTNPWSAVVRNETADVMPAAYYTDKTPFAFLATFGAGLLGADLFHLPPAREFWLERAYSGYALPAVGVLADNAAPAIPAPNDGKYHGERLDLDKVDLGARLRDVQKEQQLGPLVVLHLHGSGERTTSLVHVSGSSLYLYFEPPADGAKPLVLKPEFKAAPNQLAVIQVDHGDLDVVGADIRCPDFRTALLPQYILFSQGGSMRLHRCRLQGPLTQPPDSFWGLIRVQGSGQINPEFVRGMTLNESVLLTPRIGIHVAEPGARLRLENTVIVSGGDALLFQPGPAATDRINVQCIMEHLTIAAKRSVLRVEDTPRPNVVTDPVIVQSKANAFLNPFAGPDGKGSQPAGMLLYEGVALPRGVLAWQGSSDVYDKRLHSYTLAMGPDGKVTPPEQPQPHAVWAHSWGTVGDRQPILDLLFKSTLDLEHVQLERLELPVRAGVKESPGADLGRLRAIKRGK